MSILTRLWRSRRSSRHRPSRRDYSRIRLPDDAAQTGEYRTFGGSTEFWDTTGLFQLRLMKRFGLRPQDRLLDVGCGPLRAGRFFIGYLEPDRYVGVDYNDDFLRIGRELVVTEGLEPLRPRLARVDDFDVAELELSADHVLAFSVLNHCTDRQRRKFFERIPTAMAPTGQLVVTHCGWLTDRHELASSGLVSIDVVERVDDLDIDYGDDDWRPGQKAFPILRFQLDSSAG